MFNVLITVFVIFGMIVGAGFASGNEIVVFFTRFGALSYLFIAIAGVMFYFALYYYLQLSTQLTCLQITRSRGLTTLLPALGASCLFFCVQPLKTVEDWYS